MTTLPFTSAVSWIGFVNILKAIKTRYYARRAKRALRHLDPHLLRDIGLTPPPPDPYFVLGRAYLGR